MFIRNRDKKGALTGVSAAVLLGQYTMIYIFSQNQSFIQSKYLMFSASHPELRIPGSDIFILDVGHTWWKLPPHSNHFCLLHHPADHDNLQHRLQQEQGYLHLQVLDR